MEQHVLRGDIGVALIDQLLDHRLHRLDVFGGARLEARRQAAERLHVLGEIAIGPLRQLADRNAELGRARVDPVVDVGDVAHVDDAIVPIEMAQQPEQHVEDDDRARVADVGEIVDRRPAHIHAHAPLGFREAQLPIERHEIALLARQRIVELQLHRTPSAGRGVHFIQFGKRRPQPASIASQ